MRVEQLTYVHGRIVKSNRSEMFTGQGTQLVLGFAAKSVLENEGVYPKLRAMYPKAEVVLCSTAGEIYDDTVNDDSLSAVAIEFERTPIRVIRKNIRDFAGSYEAGKALFNELPADELSYVLIISDGSLVNGSELVRGIQAVNEKNIPVTGGLAGDADNFRYTLVGYNEEPVKGNLVAIGFYGHSLNIAHGSMGGWETFGLAKTVTRSVSNKVYEIDGKNALELYKRYLGEYADELPGSALLFPLSVQLEGTGQEVVRTILSIDPEEKSMLFAGDIPEGSRVRFMKANFDKLVQAAMQAAGEARSGTGQSPKLALLISCVGRKLILRKRIDEETEAVKDSFGDSTFLTGYYSYGEISPLEPGGYAALHNQTMTITTFDETAI